MSMSSEQFFRNFFEQNGGVGKKKSIYNRIKSTFTSKRFIIGFIVFVIVITIIMVTLKLTGHLDNNNETYTETTSAISLSLTVNSQTSSSTINTFNVCINEIQGYRPDYIELYNRGREDVDLSNYILRKYNNITQLGDESTQYVIPNGTIINGEGYLTFYKNTHFEFGISRFGGETIKLINNEGTIIDTFIGPDHNETDQPFNGTNTYGRYPDGNSNIIRVIATPNSTNILQPPGTSAARQITSGSTIVIPPGAPTIRIPRGEELIEEQIIGIPAI